MGYVSLQAYRVALLSCRPSTSWIPNTFSRTRRGWCPKQRTATTAHQHGERTGVGPCQGSSVRSLCLCNTTWLHAVFGYGDRCAATVPFLGKLFIRARSSCPCVCASLSPPSTTPPSLPRLALYTCTPTPTPTLIHTALALAGPQHNAIRLDRVWAPSPMLMSYGAAAVQRQDLATVFVTRALNTVWGVMDKRTRQVSIFHPARVPAQLHTLQHRPQLTEH